MNLRRAASLIEPPEGRRTIEIWKVKGTRDLKEFNRRK
jgi:hypothetical protein